MRQVFLDTAYIHALLNARDKWHARAKAWEEILAKRRQTLLSTDFVLIEIADGLAALRFRDRAMAAIDALRASNLVQVIAASSELVESGLDLYRKRTDKDWGLTDCISFVVMQRFNLTDALTCDEHFSQAGFRCMLTEEPS